MRKLLALVAIVGVAGSSALSQDDALPPNPDLPCGAAGPMPIVVRSRVEAPPGGETDGITGWLIYRRRVPATDWESPPVDQRGTGVVGSTVEHRISIDPTATWEVAVAAYGPAGPSELSNVLRIPAAAKLCSVPAAPSLVGFEWQISAATSDPVDEPDADRGTPPPQYPDGN